MTGVAGSRKAGRLCADAASATNSGGRRIEGGCAAYEWSSFEIGRETRNGRRAGKSRQHNAIPCELSRVVGGQENRKEFLLPPPGRGDENGTQANRPCSGNPRPEAYTRRGTTASSSRRTKQRAGFCTTLTPNGTRAATITVLRWCSVSGGRQTACRISASRFPQAPR